MVTSYFRAKFFVQILSYERRHCVQTFCSASSLYIYLHAARVLEILVSSNQSNRNFWQTVQSSQDLWRQLSGKAGVAETPTCLAARFPSYSLLPNSQVTSCHVWQHRWNTKWWRRVIPSLPFLCRFTSFFFTAGKNKASTLIYEATTVLKNDAGVRLQWCKDNLEIPLCFSDYSRRWPFESNSNYCKYFVCNTWWRSAIHMCACLDLTIRPI